MEKIIISYKDGTSDQFDLIPELNTNVIYQETSNISILTIMRILDDSSTPFLTETEDKTIIEKINDIIKDTSKCDKLIWVLNGSMSKSFLLSDSTFVKYMINTIETEDNPKSEQISISIKH